MAEENAPITVKVIARSIGPSRDPEMAGKDVLKLLCQTADGAYFTVEVPIDKAEDEAYIKKLIEQKVAILARYAGREFQIRL